MHLHHCDTLLDEITVIYHFGISLRDLWLEEGCIDPQQLDVFKAKLAPLTRDIPEVKRMLDSLSPDSDIKHLIAIIVPLGRRVKRGITSFEELNTPTDHSPTDKALLRSRLALDNIRSALNVGSIFRTSECMGLSGIDLCGYTPTPTNSKVLKSAKGTSEGTSWKWHKDVDTAMAAARAEGLNVVAVETEYAADITWSSGLKENSLFVFGNERYGLDPDTIESADRVVKIPSFGQKNCLNIGVAVGMICYELRRPRHISQ